jgi:hypothetical protein
MPHIYLAPWVWNTTETPNAPFWDAPLARSCLLRIDLRPVSVQAEPGAPTSRGQGFGLFVYDQQVSVPGAVYFGGDLNRVLTRQDRESWKGPLNISELLEGATLGDVLWNTLTVHTDATGQGRVKPLLPRANGEMSLRLPSLGLMRRQKVGPGDAEWSAVVEVLQDDYRKLRREALGSYPAGDPGREHYKRVLGNWRLKYGVSDHRLFIPRDLPDEGWLPPSTTITESWDYSDNDNPDGDLDWIEDSGDFDIVSNGLRLVDNSEAWRACRANSSLSGDDHYAQALLKQRSGSYTVTVLARKAASPTMTFYYAGGNNSGDYRIGKLVSGTHTILAIPSGSPTWPWTGKLEVNGSDLELFDGGASKGTTTDTAITGNLQTGVGGATNFSACEWDDFEAADLSPGGGSARSRAVIVG